MAPVSNNGLVRTLLTKLVDNGLTEEYEGIVEAMSEDPNGVIIKIHVKPSSKKTELVYEYGELVFYTKEPPVKGRANNSLIKYLAKRLGFPQSSISIVRGAKSRDKVVLIRGASRDDIIRKIKDII